jgi:hypothetical protein
MKQPRFGAAAAIASALPENHLTAVEKYKEKDLNTSNERKGAGDNHERATGSKEQ